MARRKGGRRRRKAAMAARLAFYEAAGRRWFRLARDRPGRGAMTAWPGTLARCLLWQACTPTKISQNPIPMSPVPNLHDLLELATTDLLTLTEGLDAGELAGSRLTRAETEKRLRRVAAIAAGLPEEARAALPELNWTAWRQVGEALAAGPLPAEALWAAARELATETLQWLRVYREANPAWWQSAA